MYDAEREFVDSQIRQYCSDHDLPKPDEISWAPIPFTAEWGISTSFFKLAAQLARKSQTAEALQVSVPQLAQQIAAGVAEQLGTPPGFARVEAVRGYLNLYFSPTEFSRRVIDIVLDTRERYGAGPPKKRRVMVEFSHPNTHKAFHVGHLRNAILGESICRILAFAGTEVVRANYIGDIGLHVIQWLWYYRKFHAGEEPEEDHTRWMGDMYAEAVRILEEQPELEKEVRALFARWDQRDPEIVELWRKTRQWSLEGFDQIYDLLSIHFDRVYFESEVEEDGKELVAEMVSKGIAVDERPEGPVIVRIDDQLGLKEEQYRVLVVLRSDGTSLYATKDLQLAILKFEEYQLDQSIYIIDVRQSHYLQQIFKTLELIGHPWASRCYHLPYEIVNLPGNLTMSSREGTVVLLDDLIREAVERALKIVQEKNPELDPAQQDSVASAVALGALKYPMLDRDHAKVVTFDWESALDLNGQAAPYIQYAHVRASGILRRVEAGLPDSISPAHEMDAKEIELIDLISRVPQEVQRAADELKTLHVTNLTYDLARAFKEFYNSCPVLKAEPEVRSFRLRLVAAARQAMANTLHLLGIAAPDVM